MKQSLHGLRPQPKNRILSSSTAMGIAAAFALLGVALWSVTYHPPSPVYSAEETSQLAWDGEGDQFSLAEFQAVSFQPTNVKREVYPYSVVAGGVRSPEELQSAAANDPVVAQHYAGFDFRQAKRITVKQPRWVYVSYRRGQQVYWTSKKIALHVGEQLITDGKITSRSRCGNQVSDAAHKPVAAAALEPTPKALDETFKAEAESTRNPFVGQFASTLTPKPAPTPISLGGTEVASGATPGTILAGGSGGTNGTIPGSAFPILSSPCNVKVEHCSSNPPSATPPTTTPTGPPTLPPAVPPTPPTQVPEPDSSLMIAIVYAAGAFAIGCRCHRNREKHAGKI